MKKSILKMSIIVVLTLSILFIMNSFSKAASFDASISKTTVNVGETFTVTVRANNAAGNYDISTSNSNVSVVSGNTSEFLENASATITYKATSVGSVNIIAKATDMTDLDNSSNAVTGSRTFTVTVKAAPTPTPTKTPTPTPTKTPTATPTPTSNEPNFKTVSKVVYTTTEVNLRSSWSTDSTATRVPKDTELRLTGISTEKVNGYVWYRVTYDGKIKYVVKDYVIEKEETDENEKTNANLKVLSVEGAELTPAFSADVIEYSVKLATSKENELKEISIKAETENENAKVKIEGNKDLKIGENVIKVIVTAEDGVTTKNYIIKALIEEGEALGLKTLVIKDVDFEFDPLVFDYEIQFEGLDKLEIEAIPNFEDATVEIIGNENLVDGENIITIIVTSADGEETATYQIKATKLATVAQEESKELNMDKIIICIAIAVLIIIIIGILISKYIKDNSSSNMEYIYEDNLYEENSNENIENKDNQEEIHEEAKETNEIEKEEEIKQKPTVDDLFSEYDNEEDLKSTKRNKGKHSK